MQAAGRDVIHLEVGEPDFPTPAPIVAAPTPAQHAALAAFDPETLAILGQYRAELRS